MDTSSLRRSESACVRIVLVCLALPLVAGCGDGPVTAIDLELVPDPNIDTESQIAGSIDTLLFVLDSPDGLYPPGSEKADGNVQIKNADADPDDLELVASVVVDGDHLPVVRLERGSLSDEPLDIRVRGIRSAEDATVALGRVTGVAFDAGRITQVPIPFNIRPELLPPRVVDVYPGDGDQAPDCEVSSILVMFSKPIDDASLLAPGRLALEPGGSPQSIEVDPSGRIATCSTTGLGGSDSVTYEMTISSEVRDRGGIALDQVAAEDGDQPYASEFVLTCGPSVSMPDCEEGGPSGYCPGGGRLRCVAGECVPGGCEAARCPDAFVCDPATGGCAVDCRLYGEDAGVCPSERPSCDGATGVCAL